MCLVNEIGPDGPLGAARIPRWMARSTRRSYSVTRFVMPGAKSGGPTMTQAVATSTAPSASSTTAVTGPSAMSSYQLSLSEKWPFSRSRRGCGGSEPEQPRPPRTSRRPLHSILISPSGTGVVRNLPVSKYLRSPGRLTERGPGSMIKERSSSSLPLALLRRPAYVPYCRRATPFRFARWTVQVSDRIRQRSTSVASSSFRCSSRRHWKSRKRAA